MKIAWSTATRVLCLLLTILMMVVLTACVNDAAGDNDRREPAGSGPEWQDPWVAYRLDKERGHIPRNSLREAMTNGPPAAILLRPAVYVRLHYKPILLQGEFILERGKSVNIPLDLELVWALGSRRPNIIIKSSITLRYDGKRGGDLFHVDTDTYGDPTLIIDGVNVRRFGRHIVKDQVADIHFASFAGFIGIDTNEEMFSIPLGVDKGRATGADNHIGVVYIRIAGVRR